MKIKNKSKIVSSFSYVSKKLDILENVPGEYSVIANSGVKKGESVAVWGGRVVHRDELPDLIEQGTTHQISEDLYLLTPVHDDGPDSINLIKHSSNPNCGFNGQIALVAMRDIPEGEEITYDPAMNRTFARKKNGFLRPEIRERYNGYFSDYIQRKVDSDSDLRVSPKFEAGAWGLLTSIDLENCDPDTIRDADAIKKYVYELCDLIEMKRFGECNVVYFGEDDRVAGYSMFQLIETSCISAHFANESNTSYIDIFSCKEYDPKIASEFTKKYFKGGKMRMTVTNRF
ncbi:MAG: S-adenosylmethionine decarboxylase [Leptospira sp.]|nr:S-adenosylmethionine decarboxylase [Leptospira sp.]